jgi:hypothetical protein
MWSQCACNMSQSVALCQVVSLRVQGSGLPRTIPQTNFTAAELKLRYGLETSYPEYLLEDPLCSQLEAFHEWCKQPLRLDRPLLYMACSTETYEKSRQCVLLYLGFMKNLKRVRLHYIHRRELSCVPLPQCTEMTNGLVRRRTSSP